MVSRFLGHFDTHIYLDEYRQIFIVFFLIGTMSGEIDYLLNFFANGGGKCLTRQPDEELSEVRCETNP